MRNTIAHLMVILTLSVAAACSERSADRGDALAASSPTAPSLAASTGGTLKETLSGSPIAGVVPQGEALADESRFASGGSTILTVRAKNVNLADGTVLGVALDFTPVGSLTIIGGAGTLTTSLGHFGVSRDQITVKNGGATVLSGGSFR
jgi:hypothetical protein